MGPTRHPGGVFFWCARSLGGQSPRALCANVCAAVSDGGVRENERALRLSERRQSRPGRDHANAAPLWLRGDRLSRSVRAARGSAAFHPPWSAGPAASISQGLGCTVPQAETVDLLVSHTARRVRAGGAQAGARCYLFAPAGLVQGQITAIETGIFSFEAVFLPYMLTSDRRPLIERVNDLLPPPSQGKVVQIPHVA